jgi:proteasome lid subunit RPN8/RPN11
MTVPLQLSQVHLEGMRAHIESCLPNEACGLLAGTGHTVQWALPVANRDQSPSRFRMDAREQLRAFQSIEEAGLELVGIFHSHPADDRDHADSFPGPSPTDIRDAAYPVVQVIWFRQQGLWRARGFWIEDGHVSPVPLHVLPGQATNGDGAC